MTENENPQANLNVPTFSFSLAQMAQEQPLKLFTERNRSKRKPGLITNVRKETVSTLLEVFRPDSEFNQQIFNTKKNLVIKAIQAMYANKKQQQNLRSLAQKQKKQKLQNHQNQFERTTYYKYFTPKKTAKFKGGDSTETTKRSQSQSKLNYSRSESKYNLKDVLKLRKTGGLKR